MRKKILSQEMLKLIACVTMLIDHFGHAIVPELSVPYVVPLYYACRLVGRIAFPIYCFLLAEGMRHTLNPHKYILRLAVGVLLAELPFDILFEGGFSWAYQNVMVTLTLGAVMLWCMHHAGSPWMKLLIVLPFALLAEFAGADYGGWGVAMIAVFALVDRWSWQLGGILLVNAAMNSATIPLLGIPVSIQLFAALAMVPIGLYSGRKLTRSRVLQWAFYLFYPVHLVMLWMILGFIR